MYTDHLGKQSWILFHNIQITMTKSQTKFHAEDPVSLRNVSLASPDKRKNRGITKYVK